MEQNPHSVLSPSSSSSSSEDEDYINMEVDDHSCFDGGSSIFSQSTNKEFEFQSFSSSSDRDVRTTTSPADELFYMGKLLPLQMVHKILQKSATFDVQNELDELPFSTPLFTPSSNTPFESCNISPSGSCHVSMELDPTRYLEEYYSGLDHKEMKKKMNMIKQPSKMRWTSYIKSLFGKTSGCSDERSAAAASGGAVKSVSAVPFKCGGGGHRRSFSGAIKRLSKAKTASSKGVNMNCKRRVVTCSEIDSPIQAAIAHCKRSQNSRQIV